MTRDFVDDLEDSNGMLAAQPGSTVTDISRSHHKMINRLLKKLIAKMHRFFEIEKASLAIYDADREALRVTHLYSKGALRSSLTLTIPSRSSLLYQVLHQGFPVADNYPELVAENVIEKRLLLTAATKSILVIPLIHDGRRLGLLSLASPRDSVFSVYFEGKGENVVADFVERLVHVLGVAQPA